MHSNRLSKYTSCFALVGAGLACSSFSATIVRVESDAGTSTGLTTGGQSSVGGSAASGGTSSTGYNHAGSTDVLGGSISQPGTMTNGGAAASAGGTPASNAGGTSSVGGAAISTGAGTVSTGGMPAVNSMTTAGGLPTGGFVSAGGFANTAGSTSIGGTLGSAGANTSGGSTLTSQFRGGPCVTSLDGKNVEVFARGADHNIYRRVAAGTNTTGWAALVDLDGSSIDGRSDLDCTGGGNVNNASTGSIHIVALGKTPVLGGYLRAVGSGTTYSGFVQELASYTFTFDTSPAIVSDGNTSVYTMGALSVGGVPVVTQFSSGTATDLSVPVQNSLTSGPDLDSCLYDTYFVAFDSAGQLAIYDYYSYRSTMWRTYFVAPPAGQPYQYSPAICVGPRTNNDVGYPHVVVVAGDQLWYSSAQYGNATLSFDAWVAIPGVSVSTAPDCNVTSDGTLHIAALDANGQLVYVHGLSGNFVSTVLAPY